MNSFSAVKTINPTKLIITRKIDYNHEIEIIEIKNKTRIKEWDCVFIPIICTRKPYKEMAREKAEKSSKRERERVLSRMNE